MTDKATPSPASVDSVCELLNICCVTFAKWKELGKRGRTAEEEDTALREMRDAQENFRAEVERLAAQAAPTLLDALKSGKAILIDWPMEPSTPEEALELMDAMDAEYAKTMGKPAPDDEMAVAMRRVRHMACDLWAWQKEAMRANFTALAAAQPSQAPVVQAVQAGELVEQEMAMLIRRLCSTTANDKTRAQAMEYLFKRGRASPLRTESEPAQAMEHPPLPEGVKARFKCEDCGGTGYTGDMIPGSEFQPPEPVGCTSCNFTGWWAECEAYSADQMRAYVDADRASSGATTQAVRMLTDAARDVLAERQRQISAEGWTPEHDDEHDAWSMAVAAACYSLWDRPATQATTGRLSNLWQWTGWDQSWFKPKDPRRNLVRAAALLLAEIERLDRAGRTIPPSGEIGGA